MTKMTPDLEKFVNKYMNEALEKLQKLRSDQIAQAALICFGAIGGMRIIPTNSYVNNYNVALVHGRILAFDLWMTNIINRHNA